MRHFLQVASGINPQPLLSQLFQHQDLWDKHKMRTTFDGTPHVDVSDILIRFSPPDVGQRENMSNDTAPIWYPEAVNKLHDVRPLVLALMAKVGAYELGRVVITRIPPGGQILAHADTEGDYVNMTNLMRYHVVLQGLPGSLFHCGDEVVNMLSGECWAFDAHQIHSVVNNSVDDRIHLIADMTLWGHIG